MTGAKQKKSGLRESLRENGRTLSTLVKMQLKEKMDLGRRRSTRARIFKLIWLLIGFAAITAVITVAFHFIKLFGLFSLVHDIPVSVISLIFTVMLTLSLITDTVGLVKSLYLSRDNTVLLTFPATSSLVFFSKLVTYYIYELKKSFLYTLPMFIAYGLVKSFPIYYYLWLLLMFALISVIPVLLAALLSIPVMFGYVFLSRTKVLQYVLYALVAGGAILLLWWLIGLVPENINFIETWGKTFYKIQTFLDKYTEIFAPLYALTEMIVGKTVGLSNIIFYSQTLITLLILIGGEIATLALCFLCSKPLFYRMASTPFEFKKKNAIQAKKNRRLPPFWSAIKKEFTVGLRSNTFVRLGGTLIVFMPMAIYLLNKLYSAMNTRFLGMQMTVCFNVLIILLIMMMTNIDIASVYSRDGASSYLNKVQPTSYAMLLFSKLIFPLIISLVGLVFTINIFALESSLGPLDTVMIGVMIYGVYVAHLFSCAESDIMNPQYKQYATFSDQTNNPNESRAGITGLVLAVVVFAIALFLSSRPDFGAWVKMGAVAAACAAFKVFTFLSKIKAFYKEGQI